MSRISSLEGKFLETFIVAVVVITVLCSGSCGFAGDDFTSLLLVQPRFGNSKCATSRSEGAPFMLMLMDPHNVDLPDDCASLFPHESVE